MQQLQVFITITITIIIIIIKFSFIGARNMPSVENARGIYKSNAMKYELNNILTEFAIQSKSCMIIAAQTNMTYD